MNAHRQSFGPRSNAYSGSKFTNWALYDPFFVEARAAYKRFDRRLPSRPAFPLIVALPPLAPGFIHPCKRTDVECRLRRMPAEHFHELRAIFLLSGTRKQERSWRSSLGCYGIYWRECVFLCAQPFHSGWRYIDDLRDYYLDDVLVHEIGHHVDRSRATEDDKKEGFANAFVQARLTVSRRRTSSGGATCIR